MGRRDRGQVAVEAALTLPLALFMVLGALQLFLMLQARILAQYSVARVARIGSINHGDCAAMSDAAVATLLPSFSSFLGPAGGGGGRAQKYANAVRDRIASGYRYVPRLDSSYDEDIFWIVREQPRRATVIPAQEEETFDLDNVRGGAVNLLEIRMIYFYPLRVPFANWVLAQIILTQFGLREFHSANPYMLAERDANWTPPSGYTVIDAEIGAQLTQRFDRQHYVAPIDVSYVTRMMTPSWQRYYNRQNCPNAPEGL